MANNTLKSLDFPMTERDVRYVLYAVNELMEKLGAEVEKDPDGEEDITPMYADDVLCLRDVHNRLRQMALPVFGESSLTVSYETL